jgi:hypothetical protein
MLQKQHDYTGLVNQASKALSIFEKTKVKLTKVCQKMDYEKVKNAETVEEAKEKIGAADEATRFLDIQIKKMSKTIDNIDKIMA